MAASCLPWHPRLRRPHPANEERRHLCDVLGAGSDGPTAHIGSADGLGHAELDAVGRVPALDAGEAGGAAHSEERDRDARGKPRLVAGLDIAVLAVRAASDEVTNKTQVEQGGDGLRGAFRRRASRRLVHHQAGEEPSSGVIVPREANPAAGSREGEALTGDALPNLAEDPLDRRATHEEELPEVLGRWPLLVRHEVAREDAQDGVGGVGGGRAPAEPVADDGAVTRVPTQPVAAVAALYERPAPVDARHLRLHGPNGDSELLGEFAPGERGGARGEQAHDAPLSLAHQCHGPSLPRVRTGPVYPWAADCGAPRNKLIA